MNVYDFDNTIYDGDSTKEFYFYCLKRNKIIILLLFKQCLGIFLYKMGFIDKTRMKEYFFCFLTKVSNVESIVEQFWNIKSIKIKEWYLKQKQDTDVIISASPDFLLKPICSQLGIKSLIASKVDKKTGKFNGANCYGVEKVNRFYQEYKDGKICKFYSDSISDKPMADIADEAYRVSGDNIIPWG